MARQLDSGIDAVPGLRAHRVGTLPSVYLIPEFVSHQEEGLLLKHVYSRERWKSLSGRRLQEYGGTVHHKQGLLEAPLPEWMSSLLQR